MPLPSPSALTLRRPSAIVVNQTSWVVDRFIPAGMLSVLSGKDKAGKTLFAWEIARCVVTGQPFLRSFPVTTGPVMFLALDDPASVTSDRLDQLTLAENELLYIATPMDAQPGAATFWDQVRDQARELHAKLIIVDALYLFLSGGAESMNQAGSMAPLMQRINNVAEDLGCSVLLITHNARGTGDVAGSFAIRAAAKQILRLEGVQDQSRSRTLRVEGKLIEAFKWDLRFNGPGSWELGESEARGLSEVQRAVTEWLQQGNRGTLEQLARGISRRTDDVRTALGMLVEQRDVTLEAARRTSRGRPRQEYRWNSRPSLSIPEPGTEIDRPLHSHTSG
jgi:hypothetical protein